jgi:hypothetical protein
MGYEAAAQSQPSKGLPLFSTHNSTSGSNGGGVELEAPSTSVMFRMFRVQTIRTRVRQQRKGHPTGYARRGRPRPASARTMRGAPRRVAGFHPGPFFSTTPRGRGWPQHVARAGTPPALFGQRLADTAGVINPELLTSRLGAAPVPGSAPACAAGPRTTWGRPGPQAARPGALIGLRPPPH